MHVPMNIKFSYRIFWFGDMNYFEILINNCCGLQHHFRKIRGFQSGTVNPQVSRMLHLELIGSKKENIMQIRNVCNYLPVKTT